MRRLGLLCLLLLWTAQSSKSQPTNKFPLKVSGNGKHLTDQQDAPFLVVADAAWQLLRKLDYPEAVQYLDIRKSQSFNTILLHVLPAQVNQRNFHKTAPFRDGDLAKPEKAYFDYIEKIAAAAKQREMALGVIVSRKSWNTLFDAQGAVTCRAYGEFIAKRLSRFDNIIWIVGQEENQSGFIYRSVSEGIRSEIPGALVASFSSCSPTPVSDSLSGPQADMKFIIPDSTVSVSEYEALAQWQKKIGQQYHKPFVVANLELPREVADQSAIIRNQAYQSVLSASAGFCHSSTIKNFYNTWKTNITRDGAEYIDHFARIMRKLPWEYMMPDKEIPLLKDSLDREQVTAFYLSNKKMAMLYIPAAKEIPIDLSGLTGDNFAVVWYSPRTGRRWQGPDLAMTSSAVIVPPDPQANWDWLLLIGSK